MSTFYGGPQLVTVTSLYRTTNGTSSYTVPSGHWAEVTFNVAAKNASFSACAAGGGVDSVSVCTVVSTSSDWSLATNSAIVTSGRVISASTSQGPFNVDAIAYVGIKVYKNP